MGETPQLDNAKALLAKYYAGQQMPSPNGGFLMLLGIRSIQAGGAIGIFECSVSSIRYSLDIPKATRTERKKVKESLDVGREPPCPRCSGLDTRLTRAGKQLVCGTCGVAYGKA
ncbi:MAG: hypothetical protein AAF389_00310 [Gemmatimonadota bacterium]